MPAYLTALFENGRIIDLILVLVLAEFILLAAWARLRGAMSLWDLAGLIAPGVMLMLAVRSALVDAAYVNTAALLGAAFVFHLLDLARRRRAGARDGV